MRDALPDIIELATKVYQERIGADIVRSAVETLSAEFVDCNGWNPRTNMQCSTMVMKGKNCRVCGTFAT